MIKIETELINYEKDTYNIGMEYEQSKDVLEGEYIAILCKVRDELLENTNIDCEKLKEVLFK